VGAGYNNFRGGGHLPTKVLGYGLVPASSTVSVQQPSGSAARFYLPVGLSFNQLNNFQSSFLASSYGSTVDYRSSRGLELGLSATVSRKSFRFELEQQDVSSYFSSQTSIYQSTTGKFSLYSLSAPESQPLDAAFEEAVRSLPFTYDASLHQNLVSQFGAYYVSSVIMGAKYQAVTSSNRCYYQRALSSGFAISLGSDLQARFGYSTSTTIVTTIDQLEVRGSFTLSGGNPFVYTTGGKTAWINSILADTLIPVSYTLAPIPSLIASRYPRQRLLLQRAIDELGAVVTSDIFLNSTSDCGIISAAPASFSPMFSPFLPLLFVIVLVLLQL
jgi:hypothetical protein